MFKIIVTIVILTILLILLLTRVKVSAEYSEDGALVNLRIAFVKIRLYPKKDKRIAKTKKRKKAQAKAETLSEKKSKKGGALPGFWDIIELSKNTFGRLRKKLLIDRLVIRYTAASDDPFNAALSYGLLSGGIGAVYSALANVFRIKKSEFYTSVDFDSKKPLVYVGIRLSMSIASILYVVSALLIDYYKIKKAETSNNTDDKQPNKIENGGKADLNG